MCQMQQLFDFTVFSNETLKIISIDYTDAINYLRVGYSGSQNLRKWPFEGIAILVIKLLGEIPLFINVGIKDNHN